MGIAHFVEELQQLKQNPPATLFRWQGYRITWVIMLVTTLFLELCALYFQYIAHMDPCERCVYQRLAVMLLGLASVVIMVSPQQRVLRLLGYGIWLMGAAYGLSEAINQTADYAGFNPFSSSCSLQPVFPFELPLDNWWPTMFQPTGICGADNWTLFSLNMAQWMVIIFSIYLLAAAVCILSSAYGWLKKISPVSR
ncbi:disulfide bond formation protein B [Parendozoicomonas haliclonae]|uniref:Disulfide bond formation protein B n=1 Tax=Parendozoicomonas haliclonae TaxID=1960125 RepID=A0A1X7ATH7_9GAMM|nr:disulfide bond formation protein B [Parendozoicomonas haliclonae]SMA50717.1 Protein-disulfide oxidoreductase DsbI [Parendozoicomonas haliclonae]